MAQLQPNYKLVDRQVGLLGGTVLLVGTVIGISVFLLPGQLIGEAGPSIVPALAITAIPMVFAVLMLLQLGGAMPVAGGVYVYASRLIGPFWGFLIVWLVVPAIWAVLLFTSIGFAEFTRFFIDLPETALMAGVLFLFLVLNLLGVTLVTRVQLAMVLGIVLGMLTFIIAGAAQVEAANYTPMFPEGTGPFLIAIVALYIPFQGFSMIVELGEELKDPIRNIPRVLLLGMALAVVLSLGLVAVFTGLADWVSLGALEGRAVAEAAAQHLAGPIGSMVALAAVLGAFTTLNAVITSYSRTIMRAARDEVISVRIADIHPRTHVPHWAIIILSLPPLLLVPIAPDAVTLAVFLALIILFGGFLSAIALWRLPKRFPERYQYSIYRLPMPVLKMAAIGSATFSALFWLAVLSNLPAVVLSILALVVAAFFTYRYRIRTHEKRGIPLRERMALLHDHERAAAPAGGGQPDGGGTPNGS